MNDALSTIPSDESPAITLMSMLLLAGMSASPGADTEPRSPTGSHPTCSRPSGNSPPATRPR